MRTALGSLVIALVLLAVTNAEELQVIDVMYRDPLLTLPEHPLFFSPRLKELWELALRRPESELQRLAADTIAIAHQRGMPDLKSTSEELAKIVQRPDSATAVRRAAAHALVTLDAKQHAPLLIDVANRYGLELQMVVEPAVARWGLDALQETWQQRLSNSQTPARLQLLAIDGLGTLRSKSAKADLLQVVRNVYAPTNHRIAAARSLAKIGDGGLLEEARRILTDKSPSAKVERVLGVYLLTAHRDPEALNQLVDLATDAEPAVAGAALGRLFEVDPKLVFPLAAQAVKSADVNIRRIGAKALFVRSDPDAVTTMAPLLDDPNPSLRRFVTKSLFDLAQKPELRTTIDAVSEKTLTTEGWRGLEQASLLIGHLNHKPAAKQLIALLKHPRREVAVTTAWALGALKVPETYPELLAHATAQHARYRDAKTLPHERYIIIPQLAQLFQLFGEIRMREADPLLRKYIPKSLDLGESRTAACWALGKIHEGNTVADLVEQFEERLSDVASMPPEVEPVRTMCAIGIGRMKGQSSLPRLHQFAGEGSTVSLACWWSIQQLTGQKPPDQVEMKANVLGWFLEPSGM